MKNKSLNKVLIPLVLLIWGLLIFRMVGGWQNEETPAGPSHIQNWQSGTGDVDSFSLVLNYRDPFLDKMPNRPKTTEEQPGRSQKTTGQFIQISAPVILPDIQYQGGVMGPDSAMTGIVFLNQKPYTVRQGDSLQGIYIRQLEMDKLGLVAADTSWTVYR